MRVRVQTENGYLEIELDKFLTQPKTKAKKFFRLMERGVPLEEKQKILDYLNVCKTPERIAVCRKVTAELEQKLLKLREEERELKQAISIARAKLREEEMIQQARPLWVEALEKMIEK